MVKTGRPKYRDGYKRVTFYLPPLAMEYLKRQAAQAETSASDYLLKIITDDKIKKEGV